MTDLEKENAKLKSLLEGLWKNCWGGELPTDYEIMAKQVRQSIAFVEQEYEEDYFKLKERFRFKRFMAEGRKRWIAKYGRKGT